MSKKRDEIKNPKDLWKKFCKVHSNYCKKLMELHGDYGRMLRVFAAKALWLFFGYQCLLFIINFFSDKSGSLLFFAVYVLLGGLTDAFRKVLGNDVPSVVSYVYKGEFFNELSLKMLNISILILSVLGVSSVVLKKAFIFGGIIRKKNEKR